MVGVLQFDFRQWKWCFLFTESRPAQGHDRLRTQWVPMALPLGIKHQEREADKSPPSNAEEKIEIHDVLM
jgi:hypothetical protein